MINPKDLDEQIAKLLKYRESIQQTILQILEEKGIEPAIGYQILTDLVEKFEDAHPEILMLKAMHEARRKGHGNVKEMADLLADKINVQANDGKKGTVWVCGPFQGPNSKKGKCSDCGKEIFYNPKQRKQLKKGAIKVCFDCMNKHIPKNGLPPEQDIFFKAAKKVMKKK